MDKARKDAIISGEVKYLTPKACRWAHRTAEGLSERYTSNAGCVQCINERSMSDHAAIAAAIKAGRPTEAARKSRAKARRELLDAGGANTVEQALANGLSWYNCPTDCGKIITTSATACECGHEVVSKWALDLLA